MRPPTKRSSTEIEEWEKHSIDFQRKGQSSRTAVLPSNPQRVVASLVKPASHLRGLTFGNKIDELLQGGLASKTMTFLYGNNVERVMNLLCGNAVRIFGGSAIFIDAANSFDPYLIVKQCTHGKNSITAKKLLKSIIISRAFTCYQLTELLAKRLENSLISEKESTQVKFVFVSGVSTVFNEQDNTEAETESLQLLMASALRKIASNKQNGVQFVVASSKVRSEHFVSKSDTAIKFYKEKTTDVDKAILMKHYVKQFAVVDL